MVDFSGQVVFVTGASRGIGRAIALVFARAGARVALASRSAERLAVVAGEVEAAGGEALVVPTDVAVETEV
ncbi:SDR family NAD(P)-dependent oxidoreductase, partial [bacterium]|nr:SDR family NAD(P)-dependent oxidoreductase [bacterium]